MDEPAVENLLGVDEAIAIIDAVAVEPIVTIEVNLARLEEQMTSNVLAQDVVADRDHPPFDKSLVDGFAVRSTDVAEAGTALRVVGEVFAGDVSPLPLGKGEALSIMTGAPVPLGADAVVMVEQSIREDDQVRFKRAVSPGSGIARRGSDVSAGTIVLRRGTQVGPAQLAVLAAVGAMRVRVVGDPISHILVTGDELVDGDAEPVGSQIRDASGPALVSLLKHFGTIPGISHVGDSRDSIRAGIDQTAAEADVLLVTGGMSMGVRDHVPAVLRELGFDLHITKLRIKPGKPFVFATRRRQGKTDYVVGLPGNPVSSFVCTLRLASRLIARLRGLVPRDGWLHARLSDPLPANGPREFYLPAIVQDGVATPLAWRGSADVFTLASADALIVRPAGDVARAAGEMVRAIAIPR